MTDSTRNPDPHDQDSEPPLTGPGETGPTGVDEPAVDGADQRPTAGGNEDAADQDAHPSKNAPGA
ncbi:hypothetical protein [Nocardioides sp. SYSU DS0663]|uniref:hypothetical protein n=1 Tax=Nocardioides sp. SYSU DS0663 TaxID=3416445 RepID=UPI003F4B6CC6